MIIYNSFIWVVLSFQKLIDTCGGQWKQAIGTYKRVASEEKITVVKGKQIWDFNDIWLLNMGWMLHMAPHNTGLIVNQNDKHTTY